MTYSKDDILKKAREVVAHLETTEQVDFFKRAEEKINSNQKVQKLIKQIKLYQKESVNLQHFQKHEAYKKK
ncbi:YlbF family regulator [Terrilactibacillus sp. S3-3]|nr:YlbF family regulator [Terrilactibacillus sp. S3-3]